MSDKDTFPVKRTLASRCYDGTIIVTPWPEGTRFFLPAQSAQADKHREKVRRYLADQEISHLQHSGGVAA